MKKIWSVFFLFLSILLFYSCTEEEDNLNSEPSHAIFMRESIDVDVNGGEMQVIIDWERTTWEISVGEGDIVENISTTSGGNNQGERQYEKITIFCNPNTTMDDRTQVLQLVDKSNNTTTNLTLEQGVPFKRVAMQIAPTVTYQRVKGFGGMYNPIIWCGGFLMTNEEMEKLYGPNGLGYSILRLMVYPNKNDWEKDVQAAKIAQDNEAIIFACPWDCTDALSETIDVNGEDTKHLKKENYEAYAEHLIEYINFMKSNGINIYAISVQNEPDMHFTYWYPNEVVEFLKLYGSKIRQTGVMLMSPETCGMSPEYTDAVINDSEAFAQTDILAGHLYQGFIDLNDAYSKERHDYVCNLYPRLQGKSWWMTEHLFNDGESSENPEDWEFINWDYCLNHLGKEIQMCMEGNCSAYVYWYIKRFYGLIGDNDKRSPVGEGEISKNGYIMAHFSQYATNTTRIEATTDNSNVTSTAYINNEGTEITVILLNLTNSVQCVSIPLSGVKSVSAVETNKDYNMQEVKAEISKNGESVDVLMSRESIVSIRLAI